MSVNGVAQLLIYLAVLLLLVKPLGSYMAAVYDGSSPVVRFFAPIERWIYQLCGVRGRRNGLEGLRLCVSAL